MAGLVGSSNNPVSGVTMSTVIVSALVLSQIMCKEGSAAQIGPAVVIYLAAFICTAACIAGDNLQDLKCGHLVGSTPWKQQVCLVIGAIGSAAVIPWVLSVLDQSEGIGRPLVAGGTFLPAPQATLMRELASGIFGQGIAWSYIFVGCALAAVLITLDQIQKKRGSNFRFPVLAVAVGIYLPFGLSVLIFIGGFLSSLAQRRGRHATKEAQQNQENAGLLLASGLITGESVMGVIIAIVAVNLPKGALPFHKDFPGATAYALAATMMLVFYLYRRTVAALKD
jgi:putative OPT family oligopeptide transporter